MSASPEGGLRTLVTGGAGALGQGIVRALEGRGDRVICLDRTAPAEGAHICADLADPGSVQAAMAEVAARFGGLDVLVHTAGILRPAAFLDISEGDMRAHLDVNVMGALRVCQPAARMMIGSGGGRIVLVTSIHGQVGVPERGAYAASKGAVAALARVMAVELAQHRIRVNVLAPGAVNAGMTPDPATRGGWVAATPSKRVAHMEEIARVAAMLTSEDASFINGQIIAVDGGASTLRVFGP
ncbi:SDR family oxidoreductase (plasmid) [Paroceanicella profunda]|uniref:SDR family oxidoreductase n=1 Tax=Paroceanicella profunda TaxID=2579971 RepID=A0A5B8FJW1_9RHOB|nr:SDR family oxidoreductase [Paroceanicella profunda]QDL94927.1 SDR family oxidoreductase [Paroceanicella profunda]